MSENILQRKEHQYNPILGLQKFNKFGALEVPIYKTLQKICWLHPMLEFSSHLRKTEENIHAFSTELREGRHFSLYVARDFCSFESLFFDLMTYLTLENNFFTLKLAFFNLIERDKFN